MSVLDGPGEGTWAVFAEKVVEQRDAARAELEVVKALHDVAIRERDLERYRAKKFEDKWMMLANCIVGLVEDGTVSSSRVAEAGRLSLMSLRRALLVTGDPSWD